MAHRLLNGILRYNTPPVPSSLLTGLVADWEMAEQSGTRIDATGRGNDLNLITATAPGSVLTAAAGVAVGKYAASFSDAFDNRLARATNADLVGTGDWTIEAWFWGAGVEDVIVAKIDNAANNEFIIYSSGGNVISRIHTNGGAGNYDANIANPSTNAWHQIIVWRDSVGATINAQIDGGAISSVATVGSVVAGSAQFIVGNFQGGSLKWNGRIGPVRKWSRVLTAPERATLYNSGAGAAYPFSATLTANTLPYDYFPVLLKKSSGGYIIFYNNGSDHVLTSVTIKQKTSTDFATWTMGTDLESGTNLAVVSVQEIANGDILRFGQLGLAPTVVTKMWRSTDDGATWSAAQTVTNPFSSWLQPYGRPYQLAGGRVLLPVFGENAAETTRSALLYSDDDGATWALLSTIAYDGTGTLEYNETSIINTGGTNWLAVIRTDNFLGGANQNFRYTTSADDGATWAAVADIGFAGNSPELIYGGADLFMFYRNRASTRVSYRKSTDNGATWGAEVVVYTDSSPDTGYPSAVYDGTNICIAYYRTAGLSVNVWKKAAASM